MNTILAYMRMVVVIQIHTHFDDLTDLCSIQYAKFKSQGIEHA